MGCCQSPGDASDRRPPWLIVQLNVSELRRAAAPDCDFLRYIFFGMLRYASVCLTRTGEDDRWIAANRI